MGVATSFYGVFIPLEAIIFCCSLQNVFCGEVIHEDLKCCLLLTSLLNLSKRGRTMSRQYISSTMYGDFLEITSVT